MPYTKSKITSQLLKQTTIDLFREKGFAKTSIREIARKTNTNVATIYYYYPNGKIDVAKKLRESHLKSCVRALKDYIHTDDYLLYYTLLLRFLLRELSQDEREMQFYIESWSGNYDLNRSFTIETYTDAKNFHLDVDITKIHRATIIADSVWSGLYKAKQNGQIEISHKEIRDTTDVTRWTYLGLPKAHIEETIREAETLLSSIPIHNIHILYFE